MIPYHVDINNKIDLFQLDDGRFQPIRKSVLENIMVGHKYVIVKERIADLLKTIDIEKLTFEKVTVWDRSSDIEHSDYVRLVIDNHFESDDLDKLDLDGLKFMIMDNKYLFVTPLLKDELLKLGLGINFSKGLGVFG